MLLALCAPLASDSIPFPDDRLDMQGRCTVELRDYRSFEHMESSFDKIASVGMFEHVGLKNLPENFKAVHRLLRPGGSYSTTESHGLRTLLSRIRRCPSLRMLFAALQPGVDDQYKNTIYCIEGIRISPLGR